MSEHHLAGVPDVERLLVDLRPHFAFPPTPDLAGTIRAHIASRPTRSDRPGTGWWTWQPRTVAIGFAVIVLAAAGLLAALPDLRTAVANRLGLGGIRIEFVDETPTIEASPVGGAAFGRADDTEGGSGPGAVPGPGARQSRRAG